MKRFLWLGLVLSLTMMWINCGQTYRPIIIPNPPTFPNPAATHSVVSINDNGNFVPGGAMVIDVSGDSVVSIVNSDIHPVHAVQSTAGQTLVVNQAITGPELPGHVAVPTSTCLVPIGNQIFDVCPSLTFLNFAGSAINGVGAVTLPIYSSPNFVAIAPGATTAYVTLPTYPPDPNNPQTIVPSVGVVSTASRSLTATIPVGANPYALAVTPDQSKLYVANQGDSTVSGFNTSDRSPRVGSPAGTTSPPIWLAARSDSQQVFVLGMDGSLSYITISSTAGPDPLAPASPAIVVPGAIKMTYDGNLNRLYIAGGSQVAIVDVSGSSQAGPAVLATIAITAVPPSNRASSDPCASTTPTTLNTVDVAALPDGSRAYAGTYYEDSSGNICPQVTVIDATSHTIKAVIPVPGSAAYDTLCASTRFRLTMAAGGDSSRAYLATCDGGAVDILNTNPDSYLSNQPEPASTRNTQPPMPQNFPQNPVFLLAGP